MLQLVQLASLGKPVGVGKCLHEYTNSLLPHPLNGRMKHCDRLYAPTMIMLINPARPIASCSISYLGQALTSSYKHWRRLSKYSLSSRLLEPSFISEPTQYTQSQPTLYIHIYTHRERSQLPNITGE